MQSVVSYVRILSHHLFGIELLTLFIICHLFTHINLVVTLLPELIALLNLSSWCLVMVERLFLTVPQGCLQFVIVVFPDHTHLLFLWAGFRI